MRALAAALFFLLLPVVAGQSSLLYINAQPGQPETQALPGQAFRSLTLALPEAGPATVQFSELADPPPEAALLEGAPRAYRFAMITGPAPTVAGISFSLDKSWAFQQGASSKTVRLQLYSSGRWTLLETAKINEDFAYAYYYASSPGLGLFAITAAQFVVSPPPCDHNGICDLAENTATCPDDCLPGQSCGPGSRQCSGASILSCSADGQWVLDRACPEACLSGACAAGAGRLADLAIPAGAAIILAFMFVIGLGQLRGR